MRISQLRRTIASAFLVVAAGFATLAHADILVSTYDDSSVERFDQTTFAPVSGGIAAGANGLTVAQGVAVGTDHTIYVSSTFTGKLQRYDVAGNFLGDFGNPALAAPSTLAFGPNGNLFVADFGTSTVLEFDPGGTLVGTPATLASAPGGLTWAPDGDLIVSELFGPITKFHNGAAVEELVPASATLTPAGLLPLDGGDFLIANLYGSNILRYDASDGMTHPFALVEHPIGLGGPFPDPQFPSNGPTSMMLDGDSLLVVVSGPDHNHTGEIQRYDLDTGAYLETVIDGLGAPTAMAFIAPVPEPSTFVLAAVGSLSLAVVFRRRQSRAHSVSPNCRSISRCTNVSLNAGASRWSSCWS